MAHFRFVMRVCGCALVGLTLAALLAANPELAEIYDRAGSKGEYRRPEGPPPAPEGNEYTPERAALGKMLFFETRLSKSGVISCATCHNPALSWGDGLALGVGHGHKQLPRRTPTILNLAWGETFFWDGRAESLEEQALGPILSEGEMSMSVEDLMEAVEGYRELFARAYPGEPLTKDLLGKAIANFERTVVSGPAPFDRWIEGDEGAISEEAKHGFDLFNTKARCAVCHSGWNFTDDGFYDIGAVTKDLGRGGVIEGVELVRHAFKTPTLRNVAKRGPYLHNGSEATLRDVLELYDEGGRARRPSLSDEMRPLELTAAEMDALEAFLRTLSGDDPPTVTPVLPR